LYRPKAALANVTVDGVEVSGGGQAGMYDLTIVNPPVGSTSKESRVSFKYVSGGGDEASSKQFCFSCADALGMLEPKQRCFTIFTKLCEVYVKRDDTLHDLTRRYHLDRNWRRLWNLNDLQNPYLVLHSGTKLRIGPVYAVRRGDTLGSIAALFETTVKKILMHNPHLDHVEEDGLQIGTDICLLPCSNRRPPSHFDNKLYEQ
jgi:LysM repeat protein